MPKAATGRENSVCNQGHIVGAGGWNWQTELQNALRRDLVGATGLEESRELYGGKGITGNQEVIAACRIGGRRAPTGFALNSPLGYEKVRNYDGSRTAWGNLAGAPVAR